LTGGTQTIVRLQLLGKVEAPGQATIRTLKGGKTPANTARQRALDTAIREINAKTA
jgi:hypothetical protein